MEWRASMKKLRFYTIMGIMFVIIFGIISHFIYEWTGSHFICPHKYYIFYYTVNIADFQGLPFVAFLKF